MTDDRLIHAMMAKALRLARRGEGLTSPNPMVGAVVFNRDGVIATGFHKKAGSPHAEIVALQKAGDRARGASLVINLEPCCHFGRTGPCTEAIVKAGIAEVIYAIEDPFDQVCGKGARSLLRQGVAVVSGIMAAEAERLNEAYLTYVRTGRPFVVLKTAQSLDGRIATVTGESKWISCPEALAFGHRLRARYDAVAVGAGTVRVDDPQLTVRLVKGRNPRRIVVTSSAALRPDLGLFVHNEDKQTTIVTTREVIATGTYNSVTTWPVRKGPNGIDLKSLLEQAAKREVTSLLFEGGGQLATALLREGLVDKYFVVIAPMVIGRGKEAVGDLGIATISKAMRFEKYGFERIGTDTLFWGYPEK
ncbi:MAG: bifunctional diaminohydroxyphosphoribosylaminopyrimidine deaminase/5-amino-6-(5-phosphoribosylamino)uracil reductase RibD [candidate division Zixibacteria bacterium]|nr:bifunctional diaminohydroxyphosphoribosylaminopyrimidine deaminase/5-amino-6-(5-phosphoribosylamino)uracil reductase RibD [candidate division Zixibacteria bacterium]